VAERVFGLNCIEEAVLGWLLGFDCFWERCLSLTSWRRKRSLPICWVGILFKFPCILERLDWPLHSLIGLVWAYVALMERWILSPRTVQIPWPNWNSRSLSQDTFEKKFWVNC